MVYADEKQLQFIFYTCYERLGTQTKNNFILFFYTSYGRLETQTKNNLLLHFKRNFTPVAESSADRKHCPSYGIIMIKYFLVMWRSFFMWTMAQETGSCKQDRTLWIKHLKINNFIYIFLLGFSIKMIILYTFFDEHFWRSFCLGSTPDSLYMLLMAVTDIYIFSKTSAQYFDSGSAGHRIKRNSLLSEIHCIHSHYIQWSVLNNFLPMFIIVCTKQESQSRT